MDIFSVNKQDIDYIFTELGKTLKWQLECDNIVESPAIITNKSGGVDTSQYMTLPTGEYIILMPNNATTNTIQRDQRFLFNGEHAYITTFIDRTNSNVIKISVKEDTINSNDNFNLGVADYTECNYTLEVIPTSISIQEGNTQQLSATLYKNGTVVEDATFTYSSSDETIATVDANGLVTGIAEGTCTITVTSEGETVSIPVEITAPANNFTANIIGANEIIIQDTESYTVEWLNNGSVISDTIDTVTIDNTDLASVTVTGANSFDIVANNDYGTITVTVTSVTNGISVSKTIEITSLW